MMVLLLQNSSFSSTRCPGGSPCPRPSRPLPGTPSAPPPSPGRHLLHDAAHQVSSDPSSREVLHSKACRPSFSPQITDCPLQNSFSEHAGTMNRSHPALPDDFFGLVSPHLSRCHLCVYMAFPLVGDSPHVLFISGSLELNTTQCKFLKI